MIWWLEFRGVLFRSNDNTPSITSSAAMSVDENSAGGTAVGTVLATDADATAPNKTVSYSITGGTGLGLFDIDASTRAGTGHSGAGSEERRGGKESRSRWSPYH